MKLQFDIAGTDLNSVRAYSYKYFLDGNTVGSPLQGVSVEENNGYFTCTVPVPPEAIGVATVDANGKKVDAKSHTLTVSVTDIAGESIQSSSLTVDVEQVLPAPVNLRLHDKLKIPPQQAASESPQSKPLTIK